MGDFNLSDNNINYNNDTLEIMSKKQKAYNKGFRDGMIGLPFAIIGGLIASKLIVKFFTWLF